jgi:hypothetical protein
MDVLRPPQAAIEIAETFPGMEVSLPQAQEPVKLNICAESHVRAKPANE